jgi:hypothetical protein
VCEVTLGAGDCTLRAAIQEANATPDADVINFDIPPSDPGCTGSGFADVCQIDVDNPLPIVSQPVTIDATTQPGLVTTPRVWLYGFDAGAGSDGLRLNAGSTTVRGFAITHFGSVVNGAQTAFTSRVPAEM